MSNEAMKQQVLEAFRFRHATKEFDPDRKVSDEDFQYILEAARLSPSSVGLEPWKFLIIQNHDLREKLRKVSWGAQGQLPTASHFVVILSRTMKDLKFDSDYVQDQLKNVKQMPPEIVERLSGTYKNFQENDFHLLDSDRAMFDWGCKQTYIALANMMTAAALIGIDSCPIEGFDRDLVHQVLEQEGLLQDGSFDVSVMAAFGYRVREPRPKTRRAMEQIVEWIQ